VITAIREEFEGVRRDALRKPAAQGT
jgi:hypothetical protein